jgi:hypothetical protein
MNRVCREMFENFAAQHEIEAPIGIRKLVGLNIKVIERNRFRA